MASSELRKLVEKKKKREESPEPSPHKKTYLDSLDDPEALLGRRITPGYEPQEDFLNKSGRKILRTESGKQTPPVGSKNERSRAAFPLPETSFHLRMMSLKRVTSTFNNQYVPTVGLLCNRPN